MSSTEVCYFFQIYLWCDVRSLFETTFWTDGLYIHNRIRDLWKNHCNLMEQINLKYSIRLILIFFFSCNCQTALVALSIATFKWCQCAFWEMQSMKRLLFCTFSLIAVFVHEGLQSKDLDSNFNRSLFGFSMKISQKNCIVHRGISSLIHIKGGFVLASKIFRTGQCWKWDHIAKSISIWQPK